MQNELVTLNPPSLPGYKIGSFRVTEVQRARFTAALSIARRMRVEGEGELEDAVRAIDLLQGSGNLDGTWREMEADDYEDYDRQAVAYYDGAAELTELLGEHGDQQVQRSAA
jgi:hypothetical protein